jgi:hypothetical protein
MSVGIIERAFQLAPECNRIDDLRLKLSKRVSPPSMNTCRAAVCREN